MFPTLSMAMLPIQREFVSGWNVPCWWMLGVWLLIRISYQRTPSCSAFLVPPVFTEWLTTRDSVPERLRYASRYITRSPSESNLLFVPGCGTHTPPPQASVKLATASAVGPVSLVFTGFDQST